FFQGIFYFLFKGLYHLLKSIFSVDFFCFFCVVQTVSVSEGVSLVPIDSLGPLEVLGQIGLAYGSGDLVRWLDGSLRSRVVLCSLSN
ncbi:hypothetical protein STEG23_036022, partial [Scotinomys teguina]